LVFLVLTEPKAAYGVNGYIDPGTGLLALQIVGSILASALYYFRSKVASLFRGDKSDRKGVVQPEDSRVALESQE